jgi:hypothetical protein
LLFGADQAALANVSDIDTARNNVANTTNLLNMIFVFLSLFVMYINPAAAPLGRSSRVFPQATRDY